MFVYLDESGDTDFRFRQGSSRYFVVTLLRIADPIPIHAAVNQLRVDLGFAHHDEFRFSHSSEAVRRRFLLELRRYPVAIRALVIDKASVTESARGSKATFYHRIVRLAVANAGERIEGATLVLDESVAAKHRQRALGSYLRQGARSSTPGPRFRRVAHHASHADNLLQAADKASGAIYARFHRGDASYLEIIRTRIEHLEVVRTGKL